MFAPSICNRCTYCLHRFLTPISPLLLLTDELRECVEIRIQGRVDGQDEDGRPGVERDGELDQPGLGEDPHDDDWHPAQEIGADDDGHLEGHPHLLVVRGFRIAVLPDAFCRPPHLDEDDDVTDEDE